MSGLVRFGVSLEKGLLKSFDEILQARKYTNRSEAIRDLIRQEIIAQQWHGNSDIAGAITFVYDHHQRELLNKIVDVQHDYQKVIISTQHVHLDHDNCLEIVAIKGSPKTVQKLHNSLKAIRGIKHATLSMSGTGRGLG